MEIKYMPGDTVYIPAVVNSVTIQRDGHLQYVVTVEEDKNEDFKSKILVVKGEDLMGIPEFKEE